MKTLLSHWLETFPFFKQTWQHTRIERKFIAQFYAGIPAGCKVPVGIQKKYELISQILSNIHMYEANIGSAIN